jgi:DNA-directed RNA polymerase subunit A"
MSEELQQNYLDKIELPESIAERIEEVVKEKRLNKEQREKLVREVKRYYINSRVEPGEVVGIIAAQSISEPATQMTMRTYHFAGSAGVKVTYGLPRLIEIFDAKRELETPVMTIFLKREFNNKDDAKRIAEQIVEKRISNVSKRISIDLSEGCVEVEPVDRKKFDRIINAIKNEGIKDISVKKKTRTIAIYPKGEVDIKTLKGLREKIMDIQVGGITEIFNALVRKEGEDWIINTIGSNLEQVLSIKEVDEARSITNSIYEVVKILGVEAARNVIISEALKTLQEQGLEVDIRHVMLVGDIMTFTGEVKSIGRYGVAGAKSSILARAAFEETIKHLVKASIRNESDNFQGIFENVMIGQVIPSGTGMFDLIAKFEGEEK